MEQGKILVVDDDASMREVLQDYLSELYQEVYTAKDGGHAIKILQEVPIDLILLDLKLPTISGQEVLKQVKEKWEKIVVIVVSGIDDWDTAVQVMRSGAYDYIRKPFDLADIDLKVKNALETINLRKDLEQKQSELQDQYGLLSMIGESGPIKELLKVIDKLSQAEVATILLTGESGTGKDLVARIIHYQSKRASKPFVPINCTAIPPDLIESELFGHEKGAFTDATVRKIGLFEKAHGGTFFLDEIGQTTIDFQAKLLTVIESRRFRRVGGVDDIFSDLRFIAATNVDLDKKVEDGEFREDLYYRLMVVPVRIPSLRERKDDIPILTDYFIGMFNLEYKRDIEGVSDETIRILQEYHWPGNIRELKNTIERAVIMQDKGLIEPVNLPHELISRRNGQNMALVDADKIVEKYSLQDMEKLMIQQALQKAEGNISKAARLLKISRDRLRYKLKNLNSETARSLPDA